MAKKGGSLAAKARAGGPGYGCLAAFFSVFLLAGLGFSIPVLVLPVRDAVSARSWDSVPCTIESSTVASHDSDDGTTYSVEVTYTYEVNGQRYQGDRYRFMSGSSSGYDGKAAVVAALPPGKTTTCWVDPADPTLSVLKRDFGWEIFIGCLPLIFVAVGGGGVAWALRSGWRERQRRRSATVASATGEAVAGLGATAGATVRFADGERAGGLPDWLPQPAGLVAAGAFVRGPVELSPATSPLGRLFGILFVALFWNGIVSIFLFQVVQGWRTGSGDGCLTLFLVPFVLVGLALLTAVPYQLLSLFNPRPVITLEQAAVPVGGALSLSWRFRGSAGRLRSLKIWVEGEEAATYRRGTNTTTDRSIFASIPVVELEPPMALDSGQASFVVPEDTMSSFVAANNKVEWKLKLLGTIRWWPDVTEELPLLVVPPAVLGGRR